MHRANRQIRGGRLGPPEFAGQHTDSRRRRPRRGELSEKLAAIELASTVNEEPSADVSTPLGRALEQDSEGALGEPF